MSSVTVPDDVDFLEDLAAFRLVRAAFSLGVSFVANSGQTLFANVLICCPRDLVAVSNWSSVESVCCRSFA